MCVKAAGEGVVIQDLFTFIHKHTYAESRGDYLKQGL